MYSQPKLIQRKSAQSPGEASTLEDNIQRVIHQIHSLSGGNEGARSFSSTGEGSGLNAYLSSLGNLYMVFQPLLRGRFIDDLPRTLVCLLSGRQDCGLEAELTKTVSLDLVKPLLAFASSLRSQSCTPLNTQGGSDHLVRANLRMEESTTAVLDGLQSSLTNIMSSFPLSGNLMSAVSGLVDGTVTYVLEFMATLLQVPLDYVKIALQFGIRVPSLDETEACEQGKTLFFTSITVIPTEL